MARPLRRTATASAPTLLPAALVLPAVAEGREPGGEGRVRQTATGGSDPNPEAGGEGASAEQTGDPAPAAEEIAR